ncbi:uncharacterized protein LOC135111273 [Scylla paramamosain]|uniref:uncharacterized protein LOC135111273 n=1 Tax=Scylla paramamosain TaxID=85552 RepID=UPI0030830A0F
MKQNHSAGFDIKAGAGKRKQIMTLQQLEKISSVLKSPVAIFSSVGTSESETPTTSGKVADERLKHSEKVEQQQETENCIHHSLPEEGIDALLTLHTDVPHEEGRI